VLLSRIPTVERPWALRVEETLAALEVNERGLSQAAAEERLAEVGPNALPEPEGRSLLALVLDQFTSPLIFILLVAAGVSLLVGELVDAGVIGAVLLLNAAIGFVQEYRAQKAMDALRVLARARARVRRDGREIEIDAMDLVPGDLVVLDAGTKVPADARLIYAASVQVDESLLTGESVTVTKGTDPVAPEMPLADRRNMVFMGTVVARGSARALVTATGLATELGQISSDVAGIVEGPTPLQRRMSRFARTIAAVVLVSVLLGLGIGLLVGEPLDELILAMIALAVSAIPEGLPVVLTITLAISVSRMATRNALVRRLSAVETLGSCSAIGSDKTGTITENRMTVTSLFVDGRRIELGGGSTDETTTHDGAGERVRELLTASVLCSDAVIDDDGDEGRATGDPTEIALVRAAARVGIHRSELDECNPRAAEIPFDPELRYAASLNRDGSGALLSVKGAPETVLAMCGEPAAPREAPDRARILAEAERMAGEGLRVLAVAQRRAGGNESLDHGPAELTFIGLVGMIDPPRHEAVAAIAQCQRAGIRVLMITGDHPVTARAIAVKVGIRGAEAGCLTGVDLDGLDDAGLAAELDHISVFARVSPQHKLRLVRALQAKGHAVAVTGDGVNDAPALKAADVGAAMGRSGTDVAREAADIIITDDNFASIVAAVEQGRIAFDNVRKTTFFLVSTGAAEVAAVLLSIGLRFPLPFVPAQLLWLNLVTNGVQDVALAFEPGEKGVLRRPPRPRSDGILSRLLWERLVLVGIVMVTGTLALYLAELDAGASLERARSVALTTMVLFQVFHVGNSRSDSLSVLKLNPFSNRFLIIGTATALGIHILALYLPVTQFILRVEPIDLATWVRMAVVAFTVVLAVELHKLLRRGPALAQGTAA
jgi:calcium-translocating P-type ATPase